jgi:hypothetical protein
MGMGRTPVDNSPQHSGSVRTSKTADQPQNKRREPLPMREKG